MPRDERERVQTLREMRQHIPLLASMQYDHFLSINPRVTHSEAERAQFLYYFENHVREMIEHQLREATENLARSLFSYNSTNAQRLEALAPTPELCALGHPPLEVPGYLECILSAQIMDVPVSISNSSSGKSYEKAYLENWLKENPTDPLSRDPFTDASFLREDLDLKATITAFIDLYQAISESYQERLRLRLEIEKFSKDPFTKWISLFRSNKKSLRDAAQILLDVIDRKVGEEAFSPDHPALADSKLKGLHGRWVENNEKLKRQHLKLERFNQEEYYETLSIPDRLAHKFKVPDLRLPAHQEKAFRRAAASNLLEDLESLLNHCPSLNINAQCAEGMTALHHAASKGHAQVVRFLLTQGADSTLVDRNQATALDVAPSRSETRYVLLQHRFPLKKATPEKDIYARLDKILAEYHASDLEKALRNAASNNNTLYVEFLLMFMINVNAADNNPQSRRTALHYACINGNQAMGELLLAAGADRHCQDANGHTPTNFASFGLKY